MLEDTADSIRKLKLGLSEKDNALRIATDEANRRHLDIQVLHAN